MREEFGVNKVVYIFDEDHVIDKDHVWKDLYDVTTRFDVSKYSMVDTSRADYSIDLVSESGDSIAKGLTREEYDALPDALKENVIAYEVLSVRVRELED